MKYLPKQGLPLFLIVVVCLAIALIGIRADQRSTNQKTESKQNPNETRVLNHSLTQLVGKCLGGTFQIDADVVKPFWLTGDFDGDGAQDVAVTVRLARTVNPKDRSKPPFNYQMLLDSASPATESLDLRMGDLGLGEYWPILVVFHRVSETKPGNCPQGQDIYVLNEALDKKGSMHIYRGKKLPPGTIGDPKEDQPPPSLKGAAILLFHKDTKWGMAFYWDGARYRWYPYTFVQDP